MAVIFKIAFRNIKAHRSKSPHHRDFIKWEPWFWCLAQPLSMQPRKGFARHFQMYIQEIFLSLVFQVMRPVSLFGVTSTSGMAETPIIPEYDKVLSIVKSTPHLKKTSSLATGFSQVIRENGDQMTKEDSQNKIKPQDRFLFLFGIDAAAYWDLFETVEIVAGEN